MSRRGHSTDLRQRVVDALAKGMTQEKAAEVFSVGTATVYRWERLQRECGSPSRCRMAAGTRALSMPRATRC